MSINGLRSIEFRQMASLNFDQIINKLNNHLLVTIHSTSHEKNISDISIIISILLSSYLTKTHPTYPPQSNNATTALEITYNPHPSPNL